MCRHKYERDIICFNAKKNRTSESTSVFVEIGLFPWAHYALEDVEDKNAIPALTILHYPDEITEKAIQFNINIIIIKLVAKKSEFER